MELEQFKVKRRHELEQFEIQRRLNYLEARIEEEKNETCLRVCEEYKSSVNFDNYLSPREYDKLTLEISRTEGGQRGIVVPEFDNIGALVRREQMSQVDKNAEKNNELQSVNINNIKNLHHKIIKLYNLIFAS